jgi:hypothetical protein
VVVKQPAKHHASRRQILSLEKEYEMTHALDRVEGVRQALDQLLILEYIDGEPLRDTIARQTRGWKASSFCPFKL